MTEFPTGLPVWVALLAILLTGGTGAAFFQYLSTRAGRNVSASASRLTDVTAMSNALTSLSAENARLVNRVRAVEEQNVALEARIDTLEEELTTQRQRRYELEGHLKTAETRIATLESEIETLGAGHDGLG